MVSESFVKGMLKEAKYQLGLLSWYQFKKRNFIKGWIASCESVLEKE